MKSTCVWLAAMLCFAVITTSNDSVFADQPAPAADPSGPSAIATALEARIAAGDLRYRDPRTGEVVVATASRVAILRNELAAQFELPPVVAQTTDANGTVSADIQGAMRDVYVARTRLDGSRERGCFRDLDAAVAFIVGLDVDSAERTGPRAPVAVAE